MSLLPSPPRKPSRTAKAAKKQKKNVVNELLEHDLHRRVTYEEYRDTIREVYDGPQGAFLNAFSVLSLHITLGDRLFKERKFDLRGAKEILDVGCGAGQIARHLLKYTDADARITCFDLSNPMVRRARRRLKSDRPRYLVADVTRLPLADESFDCVTCGYVLEHVPDPRAGLSELARVMKPGARMLLFTSEDNFSGACTSRVWRCRTYNRRELKRLCEELGLIWTQELWFSRIHQLFRAGGICVAMEKFA
jgi:ubiquinone/menaquinone biosynthesis C-methylase UbiE